MAKKGSRNTRRGNGIKKMQPAEMTFTFSAISVDAGASDSFFIDLSQCASVINRRFYRQGLNWAVAGFKIQSQGTGSVAIRKAHSTWVTSGAWEKTMRHWLQQQNDAIAEAGAESAVSSFRDYKVFLDDDHVAASTPGTFDGNLRPVDGAAAPYLQGEWEPSQVVIPNVGAPGNTAEYNVTLYGANTPAKKSIVDGYALSRAYPQSPDPDAPAISTGWIGDMMDKGDDQDAVLQNATLKNNDLPYDQQDYPGMATNAGTSVFHDIALFTDTTVGGITRLKGGSFPCGLIRFDLDNASETNTLDIAILVDLVPGYHRGYLAEPMTEM